MKSTIPKFSKAAVMPLQQPPSAQIQGKNALMSGAQVSLVKHTGKSIPVTLHDVDMAAGEVLVLLSDGQQMETIPFSDFRSIQSEQRFPFSPVSGGDDLRIEPQQYCLKSGRSEEQIGRSFGYWVDQHGIFLFPTVDDRTYQYAFFPGDILLNESREELDTLEIEVIRRSASSAMAPITSWETLVSVLDHPKQSLHGFRLGNIFVQEGIIRAQDLEIALASQADAKDQVYLGQLLMEKGLIDEDDLNRALAMELGIPFVDLTALECDPQVLQILDEDLVRKHSLLPIFRYRHRLVVAMRNPLDLTALDTVRFQTNLGIEPVAAAAEEIARLIDLYYSNDAISDALMDEVQAVAEHEDDLADLSAVSENVIVRLVNKIIMDAYHQRASDIHIEPLGDKTRCQIRLRKDGVMQGYREIPAGMRNSLVGRIKVMANMDTSERRKPQDGKINFSKYGPLKIELRVATIPTAGDQEDVVMRILAGGKPIPLVKLGLTEENYDILTELISLPYGLFLVCGPTGSGKSTSLHSILGYLNTTERKIWTAEDPVEITQAGLRQVQVNAKIGFDFANAMRAFLRADPDVIMVGEMRDRETTRMGIEASLTGHLVFSTLHTNSSVDSITRLLDMGMDPFNLSDALIGILAQRLARKLCPQCRVAQILTDADLRALSEEYCTELIERGASPEQRSGIEAMVVHDWQRRHANSNGDVVLFQAQGCSHCEDTGYRGRVAINELLKATPGIKKMIIEHAPVRELLALALSEGTRTLKQDGIEKSLQGLTDMFSVRAVCIK